MENPGKPEGNQEKHGSFKIFLDFSLDFLGNLSVAEGKVKKTKENKGVPKENLQKRKNQGISKIFENFLKYVLDFLGNLSVFPLNIFHC